MKKHLRQVCVRPCVVLHLINCLIDQDHEIFRGKGSVELLKRKIRRAVEREYPETEARKPEKDRQGVIPPSILKELERAEEEIAKAKSQHQRLQPEKNATPGDSARIVEAAFDNVRPMTFTADKSVASSTDPERLRQGKFGDIYVATKRKFMDQWNTKYSSLALPFVICRTFSGPDYDPNAKARRLEDRCCFVNPQLFCQFFSRRCEAQCSVD